MALPSVSVRGVLRVDAGYELVLAATCCALAFTEPLPAVLLAVAAVLVAAAAGLWWISARADRSVLRAVAVANAVVTVAGLAWVLLAPGLDAPLRVVIPVAAVVLGVVAGAQFWVVRATATTTPTAAQR